MADQLAEVEDECIHLLTTAFCSICSQKSRDREALARQQRRERASGWEVEPDANDLGYPHVPASWAGRCPDCDEQYQQDDVIYRAGGNWVCRSCAEDAHLLGIKADG